MMVPHVFRLSVALILAGLLYILVINPSQQTIVIEGGPTSGFFYQTGESLARALQAQGFEVKLVSRNDTLSIIKNVENSDHPVNVGFMAQALDSTHYPSVTSLGSIALEPLMLFAPAQTPGLKSIDDLEGRSVWMQAEGSGFDQLASDVFAAYGIEIAPQYGSIDEGIQSLKSGTIDGLGLLFPIETPLVKQLSVDPELSILRLPNVDALANQIDYAQRIEIPAGIFDLQRPSPSDTIDSIAVPVTVVGHEALPESAVLAIAQHLEETFGGISATGVVNEFPNFSDAQLPRNSVAEDYYKNGEPWQYRLLPRSLAEALGKILVLGFVALFFDLVYKGLYVHGAVWTKFIEPRQRKKVLDKVEALTLAGEPVPPALKQKIEQWHAKIAKGPSDEARLIRLAEALKGVDPTETPPDSPRDIDPA